MPETLHTLTRDEFRFKLEFAMNQLPAAIRPKDTRLAAMMMAESVTLGHLIVQSPISRSPGDPPA